MTRREYYLTRDDAVRNEVYAPLLLITDRSITDAGALDEIREEYDVESIADALIESVQEEGTDPVFVIKAEFSDPTPDGSDPIDPVTVGDTRFWNLVFANLYHP